MKLILKYTKFIGIFILIELFISFISGFFNLIGVNSYVTMVLLLLFNLLLFYFYGLTNGKITCKKGIVEGAITGSILVLILFLISIIFFNKNISLITFIYYIMLILITMIGASVGKNITSNIKDKK